MNALMPTGAKDPVFICKYATTHKDLNETKLLIMKNKKYIFLKKFERLSSMQTLQLLYMLTNSVISHIFYYQICY